MKIFDKYVVPTEFAMGLQKMSQMASTENSDAVTIYTQLESTRQRMETLMLSFVSPFTLSDGLREAIVSRFSVEQIHWLRSSHSDWIRHEVLSGRQRIHR